MKVLRKIVVFLSAILFIFAFVSCDPVTENSGDTEIVDDDSADENSGQENPAAEDSGNVKPATEDPATENPTTEEPAAEDSGNENPAADAPATNTAYKVLHYKQNADDDEYTLADTDNLTGTTAAQTSAEAKSYEHFTAGSVTQAAIAADGSTQVKIYYTRETITYTIDLAGGTLGDSSENFTLSGRYGKSIQALENPTRPNYKFSGWNTTNGTIPTTLEESATYTALWTTLSGITITIAPNSEISVEYEANDSSIIFIAAEGFTNYSWLIDGLAAASVKGASISQNGTVLTIQKSKFNQGVVYPVTLSATKNGIPYGTQISMILDEIN